MSELFTRPEELVGKVLPNVYIDRITLEGGGRSVIELNPHIDYPGEGVPIGPGDDDELTVTLNLVIKDFIQNGLSSWLSGHLFNTDQGEPRTIKDYITVTVIQTTTEVATRRFSQIQKLKDWPLAEQNPEVYKGTSWQAFPLSDLANSPDDDAPNDGLDSKKIARYYKEITGAGDEVLSITKTVQWPSPQAKNAGIDAIFTKQTFKKNIEHLAYFTYSYFNFDQLAKDFNFMGVGITDNLFQGMNMMSRMTSDIAVKNFEAVSIAYVFVTEDNDLWPGLINYHSPADKAVSSFNSLGHPIFDYEGWMGGETYVVPANPEQLRNLSLTTQPRLKRIEVPNQTVQDLRISENIQKLVLDFSIIENEVLSAIVKKPTQDPLPFTIKTSYFTELSFSRDPQGNCKFFFGVDLRKLVRDNSVYGQMLLNNVEIDKIMDKTNILSLKIIRRRIEGSSETTDSPYSFPSNKEFSPITKPRKFNSFRMNNSGGIATRVLERDPDTGIERHPLLFGDKSDELIIEATEDPEGNLQYFSVDGSSTIEPVPEIFAPTPNGDNDPGIIYFSGIDGTVKTQTDGYFKYIVEMEIQSIIVNFLLEKRQIIIEARNDLQKYYDEGSKLGDNGVNVPQSDDPHTTEGNLLEANVEEANFDMIANRFTQQFINWTKQQYENKPKPWLYVPDTYLRILKLFPEGYKALTTARNIPEQSVQSKLFGAMKTFLDPENGNLQGVMVVLQLLERLENKFNQAIGVELGKNRQKTEGGTSAGAATQSRIDNGGQGSIPLKYFKIENEFEEIFDANIPKNLGYYMMDIESTDLNGLGLKKVSADKFVKSVAQEKAKIFMQGSHNLSIRIDGQNVNTNDTTETTDYSYFTPAIIKTWKQGDVRLVGSSPISPTSLTTLAAIEVDKIYAAAGSLDNSTPRLAPTQDARNYNAIMERRSSTTGMTLQDGDNGIAGNLANFMAFTHNITVVPGVEIFTPVEGPGENEEEPTTDLTALLDDCPPDPLPTLHIPTPETIPGYNRRANEHYFDNRRSFPSLLSITQVSNPSPRNPSAPAQGATAIPPTRTVADYNPSNPSGFFGGQVFSPPEVMLLPNCIKALCRAGSLSSQHVSPVPVLRPEITQMLNDGPWVGNTKYSTQYIFEIIYKLEVLTGYYTQEYGPGGAQTSVKMPIWKLLTHEIFNQAKAQFLLCRLRPYSNTKYGIDTQIEPNFPILEECFLLQGSDARTFDSIRSRGATVLPEDFAAPLGFANNSQYQTSNPNSYRSSPISWSPLAGVQSAPATTTTSTRGMGGSGVPPEGSY